VAPQGLRSPGVVQYLGIPWDGQLQRYRFGKNVAIIDEIAVPRGTEDFTITATITPRRSKQIAFGRYAVLLFRRQSDEAAPLALYLGYDDFESRFEFSLGAELGLEAEFDDFRANVPVTFKFIRQRFTLMILANGTMIGIDTDMELFNFDDSLAFPIEIGPPIYPTNRPQEIAEVLSAMDADVSDISISDIAEIPPMAM
jgi:hypothetical protein